MDSTVAHAKQNENFDFSEGSVVAGFWTDDEHGRWELPVQPQGHSCRDWSSWDGCCFRTGHSGWWCRGGGGVIHIKRL